MLKQYPMLRYVLQKAFWYLLTFVVAVAINFTLPRMGENNPVDIIMGKAAQGLSPEQAKLKKETLLKAFGMAELDDQGNVIYDPEVDENGQVKMVKVPKKENGAVVLKTVKVTDAEGNPVMEERQKLDEQGNPVFEEKPVLDEKGKPVMEKDPKTKKKVAKVEQVAVMEQFQVERQDTVMIDTVLRKTDPRLASGISQFFVYIKNVFKGDLGLSYSQYPKPVTEIIKESLPWTLAIQAPTIILGWIVGNLLGAFAAYKRGIFDYLITTNLIYQPEELLTRKYYRNCDMSKYIALIIDNLNHDSSISEFLEPSERVQRAIERHEAERKAREEEKAKKAAEEK